MCYGDGAMIVKCCSYASLEIWVCTYSLQINLSCGAGRVPCFWWPADGGLISQVVDWGILEILPIVILKFIITSVEPLRKGWIALL